jgi:hypothetical protein
MKKKPPQRVPRRVLNVGAFFSLFEYRFNDDCDHNTDEECNCDYLGLVHWIILFNQVRVKARATKMPIKNRRTIRM